jgi:glutamate dehydrogenase
MLLEIVGLIEHAAAWLLRSNRLDIGAVVARLKPGVERLSGMLSELLPASERALFDERAARSAGAGAPAVLAARAGATVFLATALEVAALAECLGQPIERVARIFYGSGACFVLDELRAAARRLPAETTWQKSAAESLIDDFYDLQGALAARILTSEHAAAPDPLAAWSAAHAAGNAPIDALARELRANPGPDLALLVVAARQLRQILA